MKLIKTEFWIEEMLYFILQAQGEKSMKESL